MDTVFSRVFIPAIVILFMAMLISASSIYISLFSSYWDILSLLIILLVFLIGYITSFRSMELPYPCQITISALGWPINCGLILV